MTRILISAGEASGDLHAGAIVRALKEIEPEAEVFGMGGACLREAGGEVLFDIREHGVMGFWEVLKHLPKLFRLKRDFGRIMDERRPDCFVTVDYPGLNMRLARMAKEKGIPVLCFIPPSAWAWRKGRAKTVAKIATMVAAIFPFEYDVYRDAGAKTTFVGHPLLDIVQPALPAEAALEFAGKRSGHPLLLLLPGSRLMEITKMLPTLLAAAALLQKRRRQAGLPEIDFVLPKAGTVPTDLLEQYLAGSEVKVRVTEGNNYDLFSMADLALATSGTVTLEAALLGLGSVIVYRTGWFNAWIARLVLNIPFIGLPNIVAGRQVLPELLQGDFTPEKVAAAAAELLEPGRHEQMLKDLCYVKERLGKPGAVGRVASLILETAGSSVLEN